MSETSDAILIVEDEASIVDNIAYALNTEGFETVSTGTAEGALAALAARRFVLIILDIGLPDRSGLDLARDISVKYGLPIIFVTARAEEIDRVVGLEIGADDYVVKPFSPRELAARVKAVLRRYRAADSSRGPHPPSDFTLDPERRTVRYRGRHLELSRYEYRLLCALFEHPGRVFTREELMNRAWEEPEMSLERTVDTHIKTLRQKLKQIAPDANPIITHRGVGYSLAEDQ